MCRFYRVADILGSAAELDSGYREGNNWDALSSPVIDAEGAGMGDGVVLDSEDTVPEKAEAEIETPNIPLPPRKRFAGAGHIHSVRAGLGIR